MKNLNTAIMILSCSMLFGCGGSSTAAQEYDAVRLVILNNLAIIQHGINAEDIFLASQPVSDQFTMDNNVATRYAAEWTGKGVGEFRNFWNGVFISSANIDFTIVLTELILSGDIATAYCSTNYTSQQPDIIPPEIKVSSENDFLQFERVAGQWLLRRWEAEPEPVHTEGDGGTI